MGHPLGASGRGAAAAAGPGGRWGRRGAGLGGGGGAGGGGGRVQPRGPDPSAARAGRQALGRGCAGVRSDAGHGDGRSG
ncbi:hypothetical protein DL240_04400 [Lujinxingia litoralis]|uniref:Uncharacterized protein n=1 Tax=Lujinxingia litoralis TaxID=2211119 RepID=A0A328CBR6_9DELT|nr:hypothetical protein DL240_04400 [Lujinxingia litoralis]